MSEKEASVTAEVPESPAEVNPETKQSEQEKEVEGAPVAAMTKMVSTRAPIGSLANNPEWTGMVYEIE